MYVCCYVCQKISCLNKQNTFNNILFFNKKKINSYNQKKKKIIYLLKNNQLINEFFDNKNIIAIIK